MCVIAVRACGLALVASVIALHAQAPPPMPKGTHVLLGRVLESGTDTPVAGAIVALSGHMDVSGKPMKPDPIDRQPLPAASVMTSSSGYFVFRDLPAGRFAATVRAHGYINNDFPPKLIEIRADAKPAELRLHVFKFAALGGRITDEHGDPIAGLPVSAFQRTLTGGVSLIERVTTVLTDDRGVYRISQLIPGDYSVAVLSFPGTIPAGVAGQLDPSPENRETFQAARRWLGQNGYPRAILCAGCVAAGNEGHQIAGLMLQRAGIPLPVSPDGKPLGFFNTFYPGTSSEAAAVYVALASGESRADLDVSIRLVPTVSVSGVLTGPDGPMAQIGLQLLAPGAALNDFEPHTAAALTDASGAFTFLGIAPGEYTLTVRRWRLGDVDNDASLLWATRSVTVGEQGVSGLSIVARPGIRTSGRVVFSAGAGLSPPLPERMQILFQPVRATSWSTGPGGVRADGTFTTGGDAPGRYVINASAGGGWYWQTTTLGGKPVTDETIELDSADLSDLVLTFGTATNHIRGRVMTQNGAADPETSVIVIAADSTPWREGIFSSSRRARKVQTSSDGSFEISTMSPGEYYVMAIPARFALGWQNPQLLERLIGGATRIVLGPEDTRTVTLRAITPAGK